MSNTHRFQYSIRGEVPTYNVTALLNEVRGTFTVDMKASHFRPDSVDAIVYVYSDHGENVRGLLTMAVRAVKAWGTLHTLGLNVYDVRRPFGPNGNTIARYTKKVSRT